MKRFALLPALFLLAFAPTIAATDTAPIVRAVRQLTGQETSFTQKFLPRGYKKEQVETGRVVFGTAPTSRWSYETPEEKTFVFDGETSWMYVPADETVTVHRVSPEERNRLPFFVLSDPSRLEEWYEIRGEGGSFALKAKTDQALLRQIDLDIDSSGVLKRLSYFDAQGNRTTFELEGIRPAATTSETFTFTPPPGVDVIEN